MKRSTGAYFLWRSSSCPAGFPQGNWNYLHNRAAAVAWMIYGDAMIIQGLNTILEMLSVSTYQQVLHLKLACNDSSVRLLMASFSIKWSRYTFNRLPLSYIITQVLAHRPEIIVLRTYISFLSLNALWGFREACMTFMLMKNRGWMK